MTDSRGSQRVPRRAFLVSVAALGVGLAAAPRKGLRPMRLPRPRHVFDVRDYGARGDGETDDTAAIQQAVDAAGKRGGRVRVPKGAYRSGTVRLRSHVTVQLDPSATLLASPDDAAFLPEEQLPYQTYSDAETSDFQHALLFGDRLTDVGIIGSGTIDGNRRERFGPKPIALRRCRRVTVRGVTIRNSPNYCVSLGGCDDVIVDRVTIRDAFADGIDPDSCRRVRITDCDVEADDDAIVLKGSLVLGKPRRTAHVTVAGCRMQSPSNGFKIGTETSGDFRDIAISKCTLSGRPRAGADAAALERAYEGGGLSIESVDGAIVERVTISDVEMTDVRSPLFVRLGRRGRGQQSPTPGQVRDVTFRNVRARGAGTLPSSIVGLEGHRVEKVTLDHVSVAAAGGGMSPPGPVPEAEGGYPQVTMFGELPASVLYVRHAQDVTLRGVKLATTAPDTRPVLVSADARVVQPRG